MIIHKCDRCGKEIIFKKKSLGEEIIAGLKELFSEEKPDLRIADYSQAFPIFIDLCESCEKSFIEWFTNSGVSKKLK